MNDAHVDLRFSGWHASRKTGCCPTSPSRSSERARTNFYERLDLSGQLTALAGRTDHVSHRNLSAVVDGGDHNILLPTHDTEWEVAVLPAFET